jgi:hypothetical protein
MAQAAADGVHMTAYIRTYPIQFDHSTAPDVVGSLSSAARDGVGCREAERTQSSRAPFSGPPFRPLSCSALDKCTANLNEQQIEYQKRNPTIAKGDSVEKRLVFEAIKGVRLFWWLTAAGLIIVLVACYLLGAFDWAKENPSAFGSVVQAAATLAIASFLAYIAWQQHKTARDKLKLDLYDRRYKVYRGLIDLLAAAVQEVRVPNDAFAKYFAATHEGRFLFGEDISHYLVEVREKIGRLRQAQHTVDSVPEGRQRDEAI